VKPGDLLQPRSKLLVGVVRIYTDDQCDSWETHMKKGDVVVLLEEQQNGWKQDVLKVLFPWGIRWIYKVDVMVVNDE
jgi:hypothetical protein